MIDISRFFSLIREKCGLLYLWGKKNPGQVLKIGLILYYAIFTGSWAQAGWELGDLAVSVLSRIYGL